MVGLIERNARRCVTLVVRPVMVVVQGAGSGS